MDYTLRDYQSLDLAAVLDAFAKYDRVLLSWPTGSGKGFAVAHFATLWPELYADGFGLPRRVLWIANREELIEQAWHDIRNMTGIEPGVEKAERSIAGKLHLPETPDHIVSSMQTLTYEHRRKACSPSDYGLVIVDESHHAVAEGNKKVINYFCPPAKLLGMTATTDRADERSLGQMFDHIAAHRDIVSHIQEGWLVPVLQDFIQVEELDWSELYESAEIPAEKLDKVICEEGVLHKIAAPISQKIGDRQTIIFVPRVASAKALAAVLSREKYLGNIVRYVHGEMPDDERRREIDAYRNGETQVLCNACLLLEGFDAPPTSCIVMARPTKSRMLYAQAVGRGLRPLPGILDGLDTPEERREAIATSAKPDCLVLDLVGVSQKHSLISTVDLLGGKFLEVEKAQVRRRMDEKPEIEHDTLQELMAALAQRDELLAEERRNIIAKAKLTSKRIDPFVVFALLGKAPEPGPGFWDAQAPTEHQKDMLDKLGIDTRALTRPEADQLCAEMQYRIERGICSFKQGRQLQAKGLDPAMTTEQASAVMTWLSKRPRGWKPDGADMKRKNRATKTGQFATYADLYYELQDRCHRAIIPRYCVRSGVQAEARHVGESMTKPYRTTRTSYFEKTAGGDRDTIVFCKGGFELHVKVQDAVDMTKK